MSKQNELLDIINITIDELCADVDTIKIKNVVFNDLTAKQKFCVTASTEGGRLKLIERYKFFIYQEGIDDVDACTVQILNEFDESQNE